MQRRQAVIEETASGFKTSLRWDGETTQPYVFPADYSLDQVKRHFAECQLGREAGEVEWTFNEVGGRKPTPVEIEAYRRKVPR